MRLKTCAIYLLALLISLPLFAATKCEDNTVQDFPNYKGDIAGFLQRVGEVYQISIIGEVSTTTDDVKLSSGQYSLQQLLQYLPAGYAHTCESEGRSVHVYKPELANDNHNPLNHKFQAFNVPSTVAEFGLQFKQQLLRERLATDRKGWNTLNGSRSGFIGPSPEEHPLQPETLANISARDVLYHEANQQSFVAVLIVSDSVNAASIKNWEAATSQLTFKPL